MSCTTRVRLIATLLGLTAAAASQVAQAQQIQTEAPRRELRGLSVSLVVTNGRRFGDGYRLFDRDNGEAGGGLEVAHDLLAGRLAIGLGIQGEDYESSSPGATKLETRQYFATTVARFRSAATWQPYVGLAAGLERGWLDLAPINQAAVSSRAWGLFGRASLGLRCAPRRLIARNANGSQLFGLAAALEVAGTAGTSLDFEYKVEPPSQGAGDSDRIPTSAVPLGSVSRLAVQGRGLISVIF